MSVVENWVPIGDQYNSFAGTFDGNNSEYTISGMKISRTAYCQGLFAYNTGTIQNVSLLNVDITRRTANNIGGLVGKNEGTVESCTVTGNIGGYNQVGGVVGTNDDKGQVTGCTVDAQVSGDSSVGGVVGKNYSTGTIVSYNTFHSNANAIGQDNHSSSTSNNVRVYDFNAPAEFTATYTGDDSDTVTINGTTYYKDGAIFKLTLNATANDDWHQITGIKGASQNSDGTFDYILGTTLEFEGFPKIGSLAFDDTTNTYTINNATDLKALADYVNAGNTCAGYKFKLGDNISGVNFHIGTADSKFAGTLDGDDKTITVAYDGGALFNFVDGATFSKLTVDGTINTSSPNAAGLIHRSYGDTTINDCTSSVTITGTVNGGGFNGSFVNRVMNGKLTIKDSTFDGSFIGQNTNGWGGFVGSNNGETEITGSLFAPAQIDVNTKDSATFVRNGNNVTDSYCTTTLGTLQGEQLFTELTTPAGVTAEFLSGDTITLGGKTYYKPGATFTLTTTDGYGNGYEGYTFKAGNTSATRTSEGVYNLVLGDSDVVEFVGFPKIGSLSFDKETNTYLIGSEEDLIAFRDYVNDWMHDCQGFTFKLTKDLDLEKFDNWTPIGKKNVVFSGTFDGDNHTISNLKITGTNDHCGLFGKNSGTIKDLTLTNANVSGNYWVGGLVGQNNWGSIDNCAIDGTISGNNWIGGLVGQNNFGSIDNCFAATKINGSNWVGAVIGNNRGTAGNNGYISNVGDNTGASKYYLLELPAGVTAKYVSGGNVKIVGSNTYCTPGATFTLTLDKTNSDLIANYAAVNGFKNATFNASTNNYSFTPDEKGTGIQIDGTDRIKGLSYVTDSNGYVQYYKISTSYDWQLLCDFVNGTGNRAGNPHDCAGTTFEFTRDISTSGMLNNFAGTIDGKGYKLINNGGTSFKTLNNATIRNLEIGGTGSAYGYSSVNGAGLATETTGNTTLSNITVSANLKNTSTGSFGGIIGKNSGTLTIADSKFSGYIESGNASQVGGFVGDNAGTLTITNGIFIPTGLDIKGNAVDCATFANGDNVTINGSTYYAMPLGTEQGERIFSGLDLPEGITANYTGGTRLTFDGKTYYKKGTTFELVGEVADGYKLLAGEGSTLTRNDDGTYNFEFNDSPQVSLVNASEIDGLTLENGYYLISSVENLITLRDYVNSGYTCAGMKFRQTTDLDLSGIANCTPIGGADYYFKGTFDGQGYKISNLKITGGNRVGLFGWNIGTIKNISLVNANISGSQNVGGITGENNNGTVKNSFADVTASGKGSYLGALVGHSYDGTLSGNEYCSETADNYGSTRLYKLNLDDGIKISADAPPSDRRTFNGTNYYKPGTTITLNVTKNYNGVANTPTYLRYGDNLYEAGNNISLTIDGNTDLKLYGYDSFNNITYNASTGYYEINSPAGFYELVAYSRNHDCKGYKFKLTDDVEIRGGYNIGAENCHFKGEFDGNGHTLNLYKFAATIDNMSVFKFIEDATIKNLTVSGDFYVGNTNNAAGIVSQSFGNSTIDNCVADVAIKSGTGTVGGIVAVNNGKLNINNSKFTGLFSGNIEQLGGFVGDNKGILTITDGVFAPSNLSGNQTNAATFANGNGICNIENSCYTRALGTIQGDEICLVSNLPEGIMTELESGESITVGNTTCYKSGAKLKLTIGNDFNYYLDTLTLSAGDNNGLVKNDDGTYTLTLNDSANISFDAQFKIGNIEYDAAGGYFKIQTFDDLQDLAAYANAYHNCKGLTFKLMNDIDVSGVTDYWVPIAQKISAGNVSSPEFAGTFDGQGYTVKNIPLTNSLNVKNSSGGAITTNYRGVLGVGLFGTIGTGGFVKDLNVTGTDNETNTWTDGGLFVGRNSGTIYNCTAQGKCGGFVNLNTGTITNCVSIMTDITTRNLGGFAATTSGNFSNNYCVYNPSDSDAAYPLNGGTRLTKSIAVGNDIKVAGGEAVILNGKLYYNSGSAITFTFADDFVTANEGKVLKIGSTLLGKVSKSLTYTFPNSFSSTSTLQVEEDTGSAAAENVIKINSVDDLKTVATNVNNGTNDYSGKILLLTKDLDLSGENWTPIGTGLRYSFRGTFDGDGHIISNLEIDSNKNYLGLFGYVKCGTVKNLTLQSVYINANRGSNANFVGGIVGEIYDNGTIENCHVYGSNVIEGNEKVGGIAGENSRAKILNCSVEAKIKGGSEVGGIVGHNELAEVKKCSVNGGEIHGNGNNNGGIVGYDYLGTVEDCKVATSLNGKVYIGDGKSTTQWIFIQDIAGVTIEADDADRVKRGDNYYYRNGAKLTLKTTNDMTGKQFMSGNNFATYDAATSSYSITMGNSLTLVNVDKFYGMDYDPTTGSYLISDVAGLKGLASYINGLEGSVYNGFGMTFKLTADLDLSSIDNWTPIGYFRGTFDGGNHTISNLKITGENDNVGLFGNNYGTIKDLKLANANISGENFIGGIVGNNGETVQNCSATATVSGNSNLGAIVGIISSISTNTFSGNEYVSNVDDDTGATKWQEFTTPEGVTETYTGGDDLKKTVGDKTYYKLGATFNLSVGNNANYQTITGLSVGGKELTKTGDTYSYTLGDNETIDIIGVPTVAELTSAGATYNHAENAYEIGTKEQLPALASYVNGGHACAGLKFKITGDIDLESIDNWTPIGNGSNKFRGTFDGDNHTINNLTITGNGDYKGLFGANCGKIKNVNLVNVNISGGWEVGGIAGSSYRGTIENCTVQGKVSGTKNVGAVVGYKSSFSSLSGNYYAQGNDSNASKINTLTLPAGVTATFNSGGGDAITIGDKKYYLQGSSLLLSVGDVSGYHVIKGLRVGDTDLTADANGRYALVFDGQNTNVTINGDPIISGLTYSNGVYQITSDSDLRTLANYVAAGHNCAGLKFKVTAEKDEYYDIQNSQYQIGTADTPFAGTFDGNGKTIDIAGSLDSLFSYIDGATIKNLTVKSKGIVANAGGTNTISGCVVSSWNIDRGGFVYNNSGTLTIRNSLFNGTISSGNGFVGENSGTVRVRGSMFAPSSVPDNYSGNAYAGGTVNIADSHYTTGTGNGATKAFVFKLPANTNLANDNSLLTFDGVNYIAQGSELKLTADTTQFTQLASFKVDGQDVAGQNGVYTVTIGATYPTIETAGRYKIADLIYDDSDDSYLIESAEELQALAEFISAGNAPTNKFKLTHDIDISGKNIQLGTSGFKFAGTFDGNGYTITTDTTLFNYTSGATIGNLTIDGTIADGSAFIANADGTNTINDCAFVGTLTNATNGFVGSGTVNISNSVFAPKGDFSGNAFGGTVTNGYYTKGTAGDGATKVHTLSGLPKQLSLNCEDTDKFTFGDTTYYKHGAALTFTRDDETRRVVDGVTVGGVAAAKYGDTYKITLDNNAADLAVVGSWHIQLNGNGDTYTNREDNISILGGAGNDSVDNYGKDVTITAGEGDDTIKLRNGNNSVRRCFHSRKVV